MTDPSSETEFDYIICGGGTSGTLLANRIASQTNATILLVEAGRDAGIAPDVLIPGKYVYQLQHDVDGLWQLPTTPQKELNDRDLLFVRGKQLGGSSAVNYMALARGPAADYDEWARMTGDDGWRWQNSLDLMKRIEDFNPIPPAGFEHLVDPCQSNHGSAGPIKVGFGDEMTPGVEPFIQACQEIGIPLCLDNNSGDPVGVGLAAFNTRDGLRSYAANAFLDQDFRKQQPNLIVRTSTTVQKVLFEGNTAIGVVLHDQSNGNISKAFCKKDVVLCAGTFATPQILMSSGVGPKDQLNDVGIPLVLNVQGVGQNMLDHSILTLEYRVNDSTPDHGKIFANEKLLAEADEMYAKTRKGPHSVFGTSGSVAFPKIERLFESPEFKQLDMATQTFMQEKTRPSAEIWLGSGVAAYEGYIDPNQTHITHELLLQNNLSKGTVRLRSSDPLDGVIISPNFLDHPYDKRIAIETVRTAMSLVKTKAYQPIIQEMVHGPASDDDEAILEFVRQNLGQGYHSLGTCKMGRRDDPMSVVDAEFAVIGLKGLKVADLSVCPILTCNHTQINAYLIGERCAEVIVQEWNRISQKSNSARL